MEGSCSERGRPGIAGHEDHAMLGGDWPERTEKYQEVSRGLLRARSIRRNECHDMWSVNFCLGITAHSISLWYADVEGRKPPQEAGAAFATLERLRRSLILSRSTGRSTYDSLLSPVRTVSKFRLPNLWSHFALSHPAQPLSLRSRKGNRAS